MKPTSKRTSGSQRRSPAQLRARRRPVQLVRVKQRVPRESVDALVAFAEQLDIRWYLFGAQAVATYGVPRTTGDVDVTIDLAGRGLGSIAGPLRRAGFVPRIADKAFTITTSSIH